MLSSTRSRGPSDPAHLAALVERLHEQYRDHASRDEVAGCVASAWDAVRYFGATDDPDVVRTAERIAERELRLRVGLEREVARLDPEDHRRPAER